ncbi:MAG: matrixin family metalloprotease, partial [Pirellulales bacterium]
NRGKQYQHRFESAHTEGQRSCWLDSFSQQEKPLQASRNQSHGQSLSGGDAIFLDGPTNGTSTQFQGDAFVLGPSRWSSTATNGSGLTLGDPTVITWGFSLDGTFIQGFSGEPASDSNLIAFLDSLYGGAGTDLSQRPWFRFFQESFDRWSELTGITFLYEPADDKSDLGLPAGVRGLRADIRIGGHTIDGQLNTNSILAYNQYPDFGDMVIDTSDILFFRNFANDSRGLRNVLMHELGHGLGIAHLESSNAAFLMEPILNTSFYGPQFDDVLAAQRLYGDALEKGSGNNSFATAFSLGTISNGSPVAIGADASGVTIAANQTDFLSIDGSSDLDYYSFFINAPSLLNLSLSPQGPAYQQAPQGGTQSLFNAQAQNDLTLDLYLATGTLLARSNAGGPGIVESLSNQLLNESGQYFIRVSGSIDAAQLYRLDLSLNLPPPPPSLAIVADNQAPQPEGNISATPFSFTVTRSGNTSAASSVNWAVAGSGPNPADPADFLAGLLPSGILTFNPGVITQTITVNVQGDLTSEADESFAVTLANPTNAVISTPVANGTIANDDAPNLTIAPINAPPQTEGNANSTPFSFTVTRSGNTSAASS